MPSNYSGIVSEKVIKFHIDELDGLIIQLEVYVTFENIIGLACHFLVINAKTPDLHNSSFFDMLLVLLVHLCDYGLYCCQCYITRCVRY